MNEQRAQYYINGRDVNAPANDAYPDLPDRWQPGCELAAEPKAIARRPYAALMLGLAAVVAAAWVAGRRAR